MPVRPYEVFTEPISASAAGRPVRVVGTATNIAPVTLHTNTTVDTVDTVWLWANNPGALDADITLIVNPLTAGAADVDAVSITTTIPAKSSVSVLSGHRVRMALATYSVAAYTSGADLIAYGHIVRHFGSPEVL